MESISSRQNELKIVRIFLIYHVTARKCEDIAKVYADERKVIATCSVISGGTKSLQYILYVNNGIL